MLQALERSKDEWDEACRLSDDIDPADADLLEESRKNVRNAYRRWFEISQQAYDLSESLRRAQLELPKSPEFDSAYDELLVSLKDQFTEGGPHYDLLCERVAGLHTRLRQMEASGRAFSPAEHAQLNTQLLAYINQLQKYTEAMKSEQISKETQAVVSTVLSLVERHLSVSYPELWLAVFQDVRRALEASNAA